MMVTCDEKVKVSSSQNVLLWIFLKIRYLSGRHAELDRLIVGLGQIPLNIELKQDNCTVCCSHTVVPRLRRSTLITYLNQSQSISSHFDQSNPPSPAPKKERAKNQLPMKSQNSDLKKRT